MKSIKHILWTFGFVTLCSAQALADVCSRTPQVVEMLEAVLAKKCIDIETTDLARITQLYFNDGEITELLEGDFQGLTSLKILHFARNELVSLPEGVFKGLTSLQDLHLSGNQLTVVPEGLLKSLTSLKVLYLEKNQLTALPEGLFDGLISLEALVLSDNLLPQTEKDKIKQLIPNVFIRF